jgi:hypothetical protein
MNIKEQARIKLDSEIEKALYQYTNKIKDNLYDFVMLNVKRDPQLNSIIDTQTLKVIIELSQRAIQQGKGLFVEEFNRDIKTALDGYVGAENPTLKVSTVETQLSETKEVVSAKEVASSKVSPLVTKPKISFSLPQE